MNKKGIQLSQAFGAVLSIVLVALLVIIAIYMFTALQTSFPLTSQSVVNETAWINSTGYTNTSYPAICNFQAPSSLTVYNTTDSAIIASGNYTINWTTGVLYNATAATYDNVKLNFVYRWGGSACSASTTTIAQFATFPALIGLVGTIIFLALVIGVLVASFAFGGKKGV